MTLRRQPGGLVMARCGRTAPHGGHWAHDIGRPCAGNVDIVTAVVSPPYSGPYALVDRNGALGTAHLLAARVATLDDAVRAADARVVGSRSFHTVTVHPANGSVETATAVYTARGAW